FTAAGAQGHARGLRRNDMLHRRLGSRLRRRRPADLCRAAKTGLDDQSMKRGNEKDVETTQAIVAMDDGRQNQVTLGSRRRRTGAQDGKPEVQVLVVFSENDFSRARAVDLEDAESARSALRFQ